MNVCSVCGYKIISNKRFEDHMKTHVDALISEPTAEATVTTEVQQEPALPLQEEIKLRFMKSIEVIINGKAYVGKEIIVREKENTVIVASEIVRIAREAYGPTILA